MNPEEIPLRDLHLPEAVGWWPLAPGWWVLIVLAAIGLGFLLRHYLKVHARGKARRYALKQLEQLAAEYEQHRDAVSFSAHLSELLRRTMLAYAPRSNIAGLTGDEWLAWLDRDFAEPKFRTEAGRKLLALPYRRPDDDIAAMELIDVVAIVRQRLATPVGGKR